MEDKISVLISEEKVEEKIRSLAEDRKGFG